MKEGSALREDVDLITTGEHAGVGPGGSGVAVVALAHGHDSVVAIPDHERGEREGESKDDTAERACNVE